MMANNNNRPEEGEPVSPLSSRCSSPVLQRYDDPVARILGVAATGPPTTVIVDHRKSKSLSLIGFDPLLEGRAVRKQQQQKRRPQQPTLQHNMVWTGLAATTTNMAHPLQKESQQQQNSPKTATTTNSSTFASSSSSAAASPMQDHRVTLGVSMRDSQDRRGLLKRLGSVRKQHRKTQSLSGIGRPKMVSRTSSTGQARANPTATNNTNNTNNNNNNVSPHPRHRRVSSSASSSTTTTTSRSGGGAFLDMPLLAKPSPTSFLDGRVDNAMRSSEQDPAPHQVELPKSPTDWLVYAKLSALLQDYERVDQNFDWGSLVGMSWMALQEFVGMGKIPHDRTHSLSLTHQPIVQQLISATRTTTTTTTTSTIPRRHHHHQQQQQQPPLTVEGHVADDTAEALVLDGQHRVVVVFRGKGNRQTKPVSAKQARHFAKHHNLCLKGEKPVTVFPSFRESYFALEGPLGAVLDRWTESNPFGEVIFCGHSFGGALATLGALRFAAVRPVVRVSCYTTSCPRVGGPGFCRLVHTLPNLRVLRLEHGHDANTVVPADSPTHTWNHAGHTVYLKKTHHNMNTIHVNNHNHNNNNSTSSSTMVVRAYRFDKHKSNSVLKNIKCQEKDLSMYVQALQHLHDSAAAAATTTKTNNRSKKPSSAWVQGFVGEDVGKGVLGRGNEKRLVV